MNQKQTDQHIARCLGGEVKAFEYIVLSYQQLVYTLAFRMLCDSQQAQDVTQDVFVKVWTSLDRYDKRYQFSTWIYRITCNTCYDRMRNDRYKTGPAITDIHISQDPTIEESIDNRRLRELIMAATEGLSPKQKMVFILSDVEEMDVDEICSITDMTPSKVKSNLYLARKYIKSKVQGHE